MLSLELERESTGEVRMQYKVTMSNPPTCVVRQAYVMKKILDRQIHFASMRNGLLFLAEVMFTASRKN